VGFWIIANRIRPTMLTIPVRKVKVSRHKSGSQ
jgi:hypothetical protein